MNFDASSIAIVISVLAVGINFINVSRVRKANLKNDEEKFKRELNLKTSDEFIEVLFNSKTNVQKFKSLKKDFSLLIFIEGETVQSWSGLNDKLWDMTKAITDNYYSVLSYYQKRKVILLGHTKDINSLESQIKTLDAEILKVKEEIINSYDHETYNFDTITPLLTNILENLNEHVTLYEKIIDEAQVNFLGKLYT